MQALITSFCPSPPSSCSSSRRDRSTSTTWWPFTTATSSTRTSSATTGRRNWSCSSSKNLTTIPPPPACKSASLTLFQSPRWVTGGETYGFPSCWTPGWDVAAFRSELMPGRTFCSTCMKLLEKGGSWRWSEWGNSSKTPQKCSCWSFKCWKK